MCKNNVPDCLTCNYTNTQMKFGLKVIKSIIKRARLTSFSMENAESALFTLSSSSTTHAVDGLIDTNPNQIG